jgi:hypothetical protein
VRPTSRIEAGTAASFMTIEEEAKQQAQQKKANKEKAKKAARKAAEEAAAAAADGGDGQKKPKDLSHIQCFKCKEYGHYSTSPDCPKKQEQARAHLTTEETWEEYEANVFMTVTARIAEHTINEAVHMTRTLKPTDVLLDNQADISMVHPRLLTGVKPAKKKIKISGVGGVQLIVNKVGLLEGFFEVYASPATKANVLSMAAVEELYPITYQQGESFTVHTGNRDIVFQQRERLYVAEWEKEGVVLATVQENEQLYTKEEVRRAKLAHEFIRSSGYPSPEEVVHLLIDGNVRGIPKLMVEDVRRAYAIYGTHPEYVRGQLTKKKVSRTPVDLALRSPNKTLTLLADVMHIDGHMFLVSVAAPLMLTLQSELESESRTSLGMALQGQLGTLRSRGFMPRIVYTNPHSTFRSMTEDFPGVEIDPGGRGDYVPQVDAKIRRVKETYRKVQAGLPWTLPFTLVADLVSYSVSRVNTRRTPAIEGNMCPKVLFTGRPLDFKKEFGLAFGDYVEAYEGTTNCMTDRSTACIALSPTNNSTGAWLLWKLSTRSRIRRTNWVRMVTTPLIIDAMNAIARESAEQVEAPVLQLQDMIVTQQSAAGRPKADEEEVEPEETPGETQEREREQAQIAAEENAEEQDDTPELVPQDDEDDSDDEAEDEEKESPVVTTRSGREIKRPSRFVGVTKVARARWNEQPASEAVNAELTQMFVGLKALKPVKKADIAEGAQVLNSHMFVVEKQHANGEYDKTKGRLVADGRDQDPSMFPNKSSPTVAIHSVFTVLGLVAALKWLIVVKIDIKGAFLQTPMTGEPIYMRLDPKLTKFAINLFPDMTKMVEKDGCLYTRMLKAIYGCVHASALWYLEIRKFLEGLDYEGSETERCVFRKRVGERIFILLLYVDDILALVDKEEAERLKPSYNNDLVNWYTKSEKNCHTWAWR